MELCTCVIQITVGFKYFKVLLHQSSTFFVHHIHEHAQLKTGCGFVLKKMAVCIQDLVKSCGVEEACLGKEVIYVHFHEISRYLSQWKLVSPKMNISQAEVETIESDNRKSEMQRVSFLDTWKQKMSMKATYRALIEALLSIGRAEDARGVCQVLISKFLAQCALDLTHVRSRLGPSTLHESLRLIGNTHCLILFSFNRS